MFIKNYKMIAVSILQLCVFILITQKGSSVRIFDNVIPAAPAVRKVKFSLQVVSKTCMLTPSRGPCRAGIEMYYFNGSNMTCDTFTWGGCQGNGNRFETEEKCLNTCLSKEGAPRRRPRYCMLTYDYGYCFGSAERWYFDHVWKTCKQTIYSGCGGNENNFLYREQCESICLFRKGVVKAQASSKKPDFKKVLIVNPVANTAVPETAAPATGPTKKDLT